MSIDAKQIACQFLDWFVDDENDEVFNELNNFEGEPTTEQIFDIWFEKFYNKK